LLAAYLECHQRRAVVEVGADPVPAGGVRIEDLVVLTPDGYRNLSGLPKDLQIVG